MKLLILLANKDNYQKIKDDKCAVEWCLKRYQDLNRIDHIIVSGDKEHAAMIEAMNDVHISFVENKKDKDETLAAAINQYLEKNKLNETDLILIHEANFTNTENRIIEDVLLRALNFNFINTISPLDNTFKIVSKNGSQLLIRNTEEIYLIQSPQAMHFNVFNNLYLDGKEKLDIKMINVLGSKFNYDISDPFNLKLFQLP